MKLVDNREVNNLLAEWKRKREECEEYGHDEVVHSITINGVNCRCRKCDSWYIRAPTHEEYEDWNRWLNTPMDI